VAVYQLYLRAACSPQNFTGGGDFREFVFTREAANTRLSDCLTHASRTTLSSGTKTAIGYNPHDRDR
jgi:hypothetical protein